MQCYRNPVSVFPWRTGCRALQASAVLAGALLAGACATPGSRPPRLFAISLGHDVVEGRPVIVVTATNLTRQTQCVRVDPFRNLRSYELNVQLRDARGRAIRTNPVGFLPVPLLGELRVEPGEHEQGRSYLTPLFSLANEGVPFPAGLSARVSFRYGPCGQAPWHWFTSDWQPL